MTDDLFASGSDYLIPLLRLMAEQPGGVCRSQEALRAFEAAYGPRIPPDEQRLVPGAGDTRHWHTLVSGASAPLFQRGLLAKSGHGVWSITEQGRAWLADHPDAMHLDVTAARPLETRPVEASTDAELLAAVRQPLRRIQDYLKGVDHQQPASSELCDWIYQCYLFDLQREAVALWALVNPQELEPWQRERTQKIVAVCKTKLR